MKTALIILNPRAGLRNASKQLTDIIQIFQTADYQTTVLLTQKGGDAKEFAQKFGVQYDRIVAVGGDGTLNEVVAGMLSGGHKAPIGYIPAGSTNDFATSLGLSSNLLTAANDCVNGLPHELDVGQFADRPFTYVASFGAFTKASYATPQNVKNMLGHLAYILEGIREIGNIRATRMRFSVNGEELEDEYLFGAVSNSTSLGGLLRLDPSRVDMNDGLLELLLIRKPKDLSELTSVLLALNNKKYDNCPCISFCSTQSVRAESEKRMDWTLDGEHADGGNRVTVQNLPNAIRLMMPKDHQLLKIRPNA